MCRQSHPLLIAVAKPITTQSCFKPSGAAGYQSAEKTIETKDRNYEKSSSKSEYNHLKWGIWKESYLWLHVTTFILGLKVSISEDRAHIDVSQIGAWSRLKMRSQSSAAWNLDGHVPSWDMPFCNGIFSTVRNACWLHYPSPLRISSFWRNVSLWHGQWRFHTTSTSHYAKKNTSYSFQI